MDNYYEELGLDPSLDHEELARELNKAHNIWAKRQTNGHPDAMRKLVLVKEAREAFKDGASRAEYDRRLTEPEAPSQQADPDAARTEAYERWVGAAERYLDSGEPGLAKAALENATHFAAPASGDAPFEYLAARVYRSTYDCRRALDHINRAIVLAPERVEYEIERALAYGDMGRNAPDAQEKARYYEKAVEVGRAAAEKAARLGDRRNEGVALGLAAFWLRFKTGGPDDESEELARRAVSLGDAWGNAQQVIDDSERKRAEKRAEERAAAEAERKRLEKQRLEEEARKVRTVEAEMERQRRARLDRIQLAMKIASVTIAIIGLVLPARFPYPPFHFPPVMCTWATLIIQALCVGFISAAIFNVEDQDSTEDTSLHLVYLGIYIVLCSCCYTISSLSSSSNSNILISFGFALIVLIISLFVGSYASPGHRKGK